MIRESGDRVLLDLKVSPGASRDAILGLYGERLKVSVRAAPERGKANRAVEELLRKSLGLDRGAVTLVSGAGSPAKTFAVEGVGADTLRERISAVIRAGDT